MSVDISEKLKEFSTYYSEPNKNDENILNITIHIDTDKSHIFKQILSKYYIVYSTFTEMYLTSNTLITPSDKVNKLDEINKQLYKLYEDTVEKLDKLIEEYNSTINNLLSDTSYHINTSKNDINTSDLTSYSIFVPSNAKWVNRTVIKFKLSKDDNFITILNNIYNN